VRGVTVTNKMGVLDAAFFMTFHDWRTGSERKTTVRLELLSLGTTVHR